MASQVGRGTWQLTRRLMLEGLLQCGACAKQRGIIPLDSTIDDAICESFEQQMAAHELEPITDPADWDAPIRQLAQRFGVVAKNAEAGSGSEALRRRVKLGDRSLAQQVADHWDEHLGLATNEDPVRAILGLTSLSIAEIRLLRQANPDLLDELFAQGRFSPRVLDALAELINRDPRRSLDAVAAECNTHPLLSRVSTEWSCGMLKNQIKRHHNLFRR